MQQITFELRGDFITLDSLLKATGLAGSGGQAKSMVGDGRVQVDGRDELRKTAKIRVGQVVSVHGARVRVIEPVPPQPEGEVAANAAAASDTAVVVSDTNLSETATPPTQTGD